MNGQLGSKLGRGARPGLLLWWMVLAVFGCLLVVGLRGPLADTQLVAPVTLSGWS